MSYPPAFLRELEQTGVPHLAKPHGHGALEDCLIALALTAGVSAAAAYRPGEIGTGPERDGVVPRSLVPMPTRSTGEREMGHGGAEGGDVAAPDGDAATPRLTRAVMHGFVAGYPNGDDWTAARQAIRRFHTVGQFVNEHAREIRRLVPRPLVREVLPTAWPLAAYRAGIPPRERLPRLEAALRGWLSAHATGLVDAVLMGYATDALYVADTRRRAAAVVPGGRGIRAGRARGARLV